MSRKALAGAVGGVVGAWAMSSFAGLLSRPEFTHAGAGRYVRGSNLELDSIAMAADRVERLTGHKMSPKQKGLTAAVVHFGIGALLGALYGAVAERSNIVTRGYGVGFAVFEAGSGNFAWTAATKRFRQYSVADQAESLADHAVYGVVLETTRRLLRRVA